MNYSRNTLKCLGLGLSLLPLIQPDARAFTYNNDTLDTMLTFRKSGAPNPEDLEVNLGSILNFTSLPVGTVTNLAPAFYTTNLLVSAMGVSTFDNVEFAVTGACYDPGFKNSFALPYRSWWFTVPRSDVNTPNSPFARSGANAQATGDSYIYSIGNNAKNYVTGLTTPTTVEIPPAATASCEVPLGPSGNMNGQTPVVENTAPSPFTSAIVSDLFVGVPASSADPFNGNATTGNASYVGYFTFNPNGTLTFTRQNASTTPPPPTLSVTRSGNATVISFTTAASATYTLHYTNAAGLLSPVSTWPAVLPTITGNGSMQSFTNTTTDVTRFYSVSAH